MNLLLVQFDQKPHMPNPLPVPMLAGWGKPPPAAVNMLARRVPMSNVHTVRAITRSSFTLMPHMFATVGSNCWPVWRRAPAAPFACNRRRLRRAQLTEEASFRPNRQTLAACPSSHGLRLGRDRGACAQKKARLCVRQGYSRPFRMTRKRKTVHT